MIDTFSSNFCEDWVKYLWFSYLFIWLKLWAFWLDFIRAGGFKSTVFYALRVFIIYVMFISPVVKDFLLVVQFLQNVLLFRNVWFNFAPFFNSCIKIFGGALHHLPIITGIIGGALHHVHHLITTGLNIHLYI